MHCSCRIKSNKDYVNTVATPPRPRLPEWLRTKLPTTESYVETRELLSKLKLHTVCESAKCPNQWECWAKGTATFMIAGDHCTRACAFCAVSTSKPLPLDDAEPERVAQAVRAMRLKHIVITGVSRDDLPDGGAGHFSQTIEIVRRYNPLTVIEVLVSDFQDHDADIEMVLAAKPQIYNHNLETVRRLTPTVRHRATYDRSLSVLRKVKAKRGSSIYTKSGLMLGLGETEAELFEALRDLRAAQCDILTLGQYLRPTLRQLPVVEFVPPGTFASYKQVAEQMGFIHVASGPMVRSSYHAEEVSKSPLSLPT